MIKEDGTGLSAPIEIPGWGNVSVQQCLETISAVCAEQYGVIFGGEEDIYLKARTYKRLFEDEVQQISRYAAAVTLRRWAKQADVDLEPDLEEELVRVEKDIRYLRRPQWKKPVIPVEEDETLVMSLAEFLGKTASGEVAHGEVSRSKNDDKVIWKSGEKEPGSRPSFKKKSLALLAFDIANDLYSLATSEKDRGVIVSFDAIRPHTRVRLDKEFDAHALFAECLRTRQNVLDLPDVSWLSNIKNGVIVIVNGYVYDEACMLEESESYRTLMTLSTLGRLPDTADVCCRIDAYGKGYPMEVAEQIASQMGWDVIYCDDAQIGRRLNASYTQEDFIRYRPEELSWRYFYQYPGVLKEEYSDYVYKRASALPLCAAAEESAAIAAAIYPVDVIVSEPDSEYNDEQIHQLIKIMTGASSYLPIKYEDVPKFAYRHFAAGYLSYLREIEDLRNHVGAFAYLDDPESREWIEEVGEPTDLSVFPVFDTKKIYQEELESAKVLFDGLSSIWASALEAERYDERDRIVEIARQEMGDEADTISEWQLCQEVEGIGFEDLCAFLKKVYNDWAIDSSILALTRGVPPEHITG